MTGTDSKPQWAAVSGGWEHACLCWHMLARGNITGCSSSLFTVICKPIFKIVCKTPTIFVERNMICTVGSWGNLFHGPDALAQTPSPCFPHPTDLQPCAPVSLSAHHICQLSLDILYPEAKYASLCSAVPLIHPPSSLPVTVRSPQSRQPFFHSYPSHCAPQGGQGDPFKL